MKYAVKNCRLLDGTMDMTVRKDVTILVADGRIERVGEGISVPQGYKVIDAKGGYAVPGLINLHAHLFGTGRPSKALSGGDAQKKLLKLINSKLGLKILTTLVSASVKAELMGGVTTVRSVGDFRYSDVIVRDKVNKGKLLGPRMLVSGPAITAVGGHGASTFAFSSNDPEELRRLVRKNVEHNVDFIKTCVTGGVMDATKMGEPAEMKMTEEQITAVCEEAHAAGMKVASHTESPEGVRVDLLAGVDTVEHGAPVSAELIKSYKEQGTAYVLTLSPAVPLASLPYDVTKLNPVGESVAKVVMQNMIDGAKQAIAEGVIFGIGTDASCPFCAQYNMWRELAYLEKYIGTSRAFALYTGTLGNAKILGIDKETGSIEEGKSADILILRENPLDSLRALSAPEKIFVRGRLINKPKVKKNPYIEETLDKFI